MLQEGDTGAAVKTLQTRLNAWGATLVVDGDFGPATLAAVKAFQTAHHLSVDGIVGPLTWAALNATPPAASRRAPVPRPRASTVGRGYPTRRAQPQRTPRESSAARFACTDATARNASRR